MVNKMEATKIWLNGYNKKVVVTNDVLQFP